MSCGRVCDHRGARTRPLLSVNRDQIERTIEAVWHMESAKIIAKLARMLRSVGLAEEITQDAWVKALEDWVANGIPDNPGAWLMTAAKNRAIDQIRRKKLMERKSVIMADDTETSHAETEDVEDDLLRLIFVACHPVLSMEGRIALTLRLLGGLTPAEIARAFLTTESTVQQRIVRAKRTLSELHVSFEVPGAAERDQRLGSVLEVIYLIFNEGYAATSGDEWMRPALCEEALRLGRILAELTPAESEVHGLVSLMELQTSRTSARIGRSGELIVLLKQNRSLWDQLLIRRGLAALARAQRLDDPLGPYFLQAAIAACHAQARTAEQTDWPQIVALYDALHATQPSPVVALNRAVAVSMAQGPAEALEILDALRSDSRLRDYHLLPSVRGDFLERLGRLDEARAEFSRAAALTNNAREQQFLRARVAACKKPAAPLN
jgi:RNA polymerase sigma factor (sigma-70 family)